MNVNINDLTIGQAKELQQMLGGETQGNNSIDSDFINQYCIIRTYSAGVWFGKVIKKSSNEIILSEARRLYYWKTNGGISLSEVSLTGLADESKVCAEIDKIWMQSVEIIQCTKIATKSIQEKKDYVYNR